ncbi:hypothetical protein G3A_16760 [Bacillus sp. 17376]|uniref:hypothetical protein n=1 Tax=Mesobacillus boroniphilus TaxID=308892 RepID=UPI0003C78E88|nr:hypothetical protein [Mesobacillus boroniphilus]ESU31434.1 hypothetical protein G3A_16760 [Bacillus sp. 17376]
MKKKLNFWSFIFSTIWVLLFFIVSSTGPIVYNILGIHPFVLLLCVTMLTFVTGLTGMAGMEGWKAMARSFSTIILTLGLSALLAIVIFFGKLLSY